ncbi:unnamed protein product [Amoebophrya sp. A120]|nr:unnamed protein product [Amoebophrya sp. A120]|eukprot:GSA120T00016637001.1
MADHFYFPEKSLTSNDDDHDGSFWFGAGLERERSNPTLFGALKENVDWEVRESSAGGLGVFAKRNIRCGSLILCEAPLLAISDLKLDRTRNDVDDKQVKLGNIHAGTPEDGQEHGLVRTSWTKLEKIRANASLIDKYYAALTEDKKSRFLQLHDASGDLRQWHSRQVNASTMATVEQVEDASARSDGQWSVRDINARTDSIKKTPAGVFFSNVFGTSPGCVYEKISRFNHSCAPNAAADPDITARLQEFEGHDQWSLKCVKATRDLASGEEIFIDYLGLQSCEKDGGSFVSLDSALILQSHSVRQSYLRFSFGKPCACPVCCVSTTTSDRNREKVIAKWQELPTDDEIAAVLMVGSSSKKCSIGDALLHQARRTDLLAREIFELLFYGEKLRHLFPVFEELADSVLLLWENNAASEIDPTSGCEKTTPTTRLRRGAQLLEKNRVLAFWLRLKYEIVRFQRGQEDPESRACHLDWLEAARTCEPS